LSDAPAGSWFAMEAAGYDKNQDALSKSGLAIIM
jgi:hypothetical protein